MTTQHTKATIEERVEYIATYMRLPITIDELGDRLRISITHRDSRYPRYLSPPLTRAFMSVWLDGFIEGIDTMKRIKSAEGRTYYRR